MSDRNKLAILIGKFDLATGTIRCSDISFGVDVDLDKIEGYEYELIRVKGQDS